MKILRDITKSQLLLLEKNGLLHKDKCVSVNLNSNKKYDIDFITSKAYFDAYDFLFSEQRVKIIKELGSIENEKKEEITEKNNLIDELEKAKEKEIGDGNYSVAVGIDKAIKIVKEYQNNR